MKTEAEIRLHRDALRAALKRPCGCAGTRHALECHIGAKMMAAVRETLDWILGENEEHAHLHERLIAEMRRDPPA